MLEAAGYPDRKGALTEVSNQQNVPAPTLHRWYHSKNNPAPNELVKRNEEELATLYRTEIDKIFEHIDSAREFADYRALVTAIGILTDKVMLLEGKATSRIEVDIKIVGKLVSILQVHNIDVMEFFNNAIRFIELQGHEQAERADESE